MLGDNMKRVFSLLIVMSIIYVLLQFGFQLIEKGHKVNYKIKNDNNNFEINEIYTKNKTGEQDNYYFDITINDSKFFYQTLVDFNMQSKVIKNIHYYKDDNYECILPIYIKDKILSDVICKKGDTQYFYHDIKNNDTALDQFVNSLSNNGYIDKYSDNNEILSNKSSVVLYDNLIDNHYLGLETYKGLNTINNKNNDNIYNIMLFTKDVYQKPISTAVSKYYLVADYSKDYKFNEFILVDLTNNIKTTLPYDYDISMNSYIQGVVDYNVYLFDRSTKKQYEIDVKHETIIEVGNTDVGFKKYCNGTWEKETSYDFTFSKYCTDNTWNGNNYERVDKTGIKYSGYYYIYENIGGKYNIYRSDVQNSTVKTYLFTTNELNNIVYVGDSIYYQDGKTIKRYNDEFGVKTILTNSELEFNNNIKFMAYQK